MLYKVSRLLLLIKILEEISPLKESKQKLEYNHLPIRRKIRTRTLIFLKNVCTGGVRILRSGMDCIACYVMYIKQISFSLSKVLFCFERHGPNKEA